MKKQPKLKQKKPNRKAGQPLPQSPVQVIQEAVITVQAILKARKLVLPPDIRAEFERLETLPEGKPTSEQIAWIDDVLCRYRPSRNMVLSCILEIKFGNDKQLEFELKSEPHNHRSRYAQRCMARAFSHSVMLAVDCIASANAIRQSIPHVIRDEFDRIIAIAYDDLTNEEYDWLESMKETFKPDGNTCAFHLEHLLKFMKFDIHQPGTETAGNYDLDQVMATLSKSASWPRLTSVADPAVRHDVARSRPSSRAHTI